MIGLDLPPGLEIPRPAIIRPAEHSLLRPGAFRPCGRVERREIIADLLKTRRLTPAEAKRALFFVPVVGWSATVPLPEVTFTATTGTNTNNQNFTFSNVPIGAASSDRIVLVGATSFIANSSREMIGCTIGGVSAIAAVIQTDISLAAAGWFYLIVTSGTNSTIVVEHAASGVGNCQIYVYAVKNYASATPYATGQDADVNTTTLTPNINTPTGGSVVFGAFCSAWDGTHSHSWSGLTEQFEVSRDNNTQMSFAEETISSGGPPLNVAAQTSNAREDLAAATVCWQ